MQRYNILWADDEIDLLKPHILFLEQKGYDITPVNSGADALDKFEETDFDIIFLDENMPGMSGLETLTQMKAIRPNTPVIMITKSEEEYIMEEAIGAKITDYLIKPLNPHQILLSVKKVLDNKRLITEKTNHSYQQEFRNISMAFGDDLNHSEWADIYKKLIYWEIEMEDIEDSGMSEILEMQKSEANTNFSKFVINNYESWLNDPDSDKPLLSHQLMRKKIIPEIKDDRPLFFIVIDNLRYDQWKIIEPAISEMFKIEKEESYYSILPTTTAYARNSIFSGMLPSEMAQKHSDIWMDEEDEGGKNNSEDEFIERQLKKLNLPIKFTYNKIKRSSEGRSLVDNLNNLYDVPLNVIVYNFVDMLSHARTDMAMIKELAPDESAYRSITKSWFEHSPLIDALRKIASIKAKVIITTDHGTIRVKKPFKIIGDRNTNTNLRYKQGRNLSYTPNNVMEVAKPERLFLPKQNMSSTYAIAIEDNFFVYPNNYNHFANHFRDTFQHGGVSMEEMIIPIITLKTKIT